MDATNPVAVEESRALALALRGLSEPSPKGIRADARGSLACETGSLDVRRQQYCGVCMCVFWDQIYVEIARTVKTD